MSEFTGHINNTVDSDAGRSASVEVEAESEWYWPTEGQFYEVSDGTKLTLTFTHKFKEIYAMTFEPVIQVGQPQWERAPTADATFLVKSPGYRAKEREEWRTRINALLREQGTESRAQLAKTAMQGGIASLVKAATDWSKDFASVLRSLIVTASQVCDGAECEISIASNFQSNKDVPNAVLQNAGQGSAGKGIPEMPVLRINKESGIRATFPLRRPGPAVINMTFRPYWAVRCHGSGFSIQAECQVDHSASDDLTNWEKNRLSEFVNQPVFETYELAPDIEEGVLKNDPDSIKEATSSLPTTTRESWQEARYAFEAALLTGES